MRIIIVGGNHAGIAAANRLREEYPDDEVVVFERKDEITFIAQTIPLFLMGIQDIKTQSNYAKPEEIINYGIDLRLNTEVLEIDSQQKLLKYRKNPDGIKEQINYDKLIMATGSYSNLPPTGGKLNETLFILKERRDAEFVEKFISESHEAVVVGAGLIGVEIARILRQRGIDVKLIYPHTHILNRYLNETASIEVELQLKKEGIVLCPNNRAIRYHTIEKRMWKRSKIEIFLENGSSIKSDGVFVSIGFKPNSFLLSGQVKLGDKGALLVDPYMYTSNPDILAIGDCSTTYMDLIEKNIYNPHASDAFRQGLIAAINSHEIRQKISTTTGTYKFNMDGFTIAKTGITMQEAEEAGIVVEEVHYQNHYLENSPGLSYNVIGNTYESNLLHKTVDDYSSIHLVYEKDTHRILGLQVLGTVDISQYVNIISLAIQEKLSIEQLEFTDFFFEHGYKNPLGFTKILSELVRNKKK